MDIRHVAGLLSEIPGIGNVFLDESMKNHTSFKVGGPADILVIPLTIEALGGILSICRYDNIPFFVLGKGTNLIVSDNGIRGVVIKISGNFNGVSVCNDIIEAEAGILLSRLSEIAMENGLSGFEFASGIPGTFGGAVAMNAGAYIGEMKDVVIGSKYIDTEGYIKEVNGDQQNFGYRTSFIQKADGIIISARVKLSKGNKSDIKALMDDLNQRRKDKQPLEMPSAGSVFKRPEGHFAGKLIEDCNLRGYRIGGAEVSGKHCGFIVNADNATANDIISLIKHIQATVKLKFGVELQTEVKIIGEE